MIFQVCFWVGIIFRKNYKINKNGFDEYSNFIINSAEFYGTNLKKCESWIIIYVIGGQNNWNQLEKNENVEIII